jgi:hypothetical protein
MASKAVGATVTALAVVGAKLVELVELVSSRVGKTVRKRSSVA